MRTVEEVLAGERISEPARTLAVAALQGSEALAAALDGRGVPTGAADPGDGSRSGSAWLRRIEVGAFQGIGDPVRLEFDPGPGLIVLVGRNGAGKSSLAEAAELALTGTSSRWEGRTKVWKESWRNLHASESPRIEVEVVLEDEPDSVVVTVEPSGSSASGKPKVRIGTRMTSFDQLGWSAGLESFRPFLPYADLGALLGGKSTVAHDALTRGLDLSAPTAAVKALKDVALERSKEWKAVVEDGTSLVTRLKSLDDDRAAKCAAAIRRPEPDLDLIGEIVAGTGAGSSQDLEVLRRILAITPPDPAAMERAGAELRDALRENERMSRTDAGRDLAVAAILQRAIAVHREHDLEACPVCGVGRLDGEWLDRAEGAERDLRSGAASAMDAAKRLEAARAGLRRLIPTAVPTIPALDAFGIDVSGPMRGFRSLVDAHRIEEDDERVAAAVERATNVVVALDGLRERVTAIIAELEDAWRDVAPLVAAWLDRARRAQAARGLISPLTEAKAAMESVLDALRVERWRPVEDVVRGLWELLRVQSNVALEGLEPAGRGAQRRIDVRLSVDGVADAKLGVMSQGELNALALSLFLPRVTLPDSPFRFVILDDPIQSMDVARVDGFAQVLGRLSEARQIVVFTHDSRLVEALDRLQIAATVRRVERDVRSRVRVRTTSTPAQRYISDARALVATGVPVEFGRLSVPVLARLAIEARCLQVIRARLVSGGESEVDSDALIEGLTRTLEMVSYVMFDEVGREKDLYATMNQRFGGWSVDTLKAVASGSHGGFEGDPKKLIKDTERLIAELK